MSITLTPDIEQALAAEAYRLGCTPAQVALDSLRERFLSPESDLSPRGEQATLADFLRGHLGVLHSSESVPGGAHLSEDSGRKFTAALITQRHQQRP
jgi:hypothetical protein